MWSLNLVYIYIIFYLHKDITSFSVLHPSACFFSYRRKIEEKVIDNKNSTDMDGRSSYVLFLVSVFIFSVAGRRGLGKRIATIHVTNSMPRELQPIQLSCNSRYKYHGMHQLHVADDYQFGVEEKALHFCEAISGKQIASWHAYQPRRDWKHKAVFWRVKENGFFLSWDNSSWVRKSVWQTE